MYVDVFFIKLVMQLTGPEKKNSRTSLGCSDIYCLAMENLNKSKNFQHYNRVPSCRMQCKLPGDFILAMF